MKKVTILLILIYFKSNVYHQNLISEWSNDRKNTDFYERNKKLKDINFNSNFFENIEVSDFSCRKINLEIDNIRNVVTVLTKEVYIFWFTGTRIQMKGPYGSL